MVGFIPKQKAATSTPTLTTATATATTTPPTTPTTLPKKTTAFSLPHRKVEVVVDTLPLLPLQPLADVDLPGRLQLLL